MKSLAVELRLFVHSKSILTLVLLLAVFAELIQGGVVEIVMPYYPLYVKAGSNLTIICESEYTSSTSDLKWIQATPETSWSDQPIVARSGSNIVIQSFREEPSGFTRSTLIKRNTLLTDRGTYICKYDANNYAVWVTVLHISARNLTEFSPRVDPLILGCGISGFDSNLPAIDYDWTFNGSFISHPHYDVAATVRHSPIHRAPVDKYKVEMRDNLLRLEIYDPSSLDGGSYNCVFTLGTNLGPVTFTESIYVDGSMLTFRNFGVKSSLSFLAAIYAAVLVLAVSSSVL